MAANIKSPNFGFLSKQDEVLVRLAAAAERYVFDDANAALVKIRQFAELLAQHVAAYAGIAITEHDKFHEVLERLWQSRITPSQVSQLFHGIRKSGNSAVHEHNNDRREALHQLQMARKLAVWFQKSFRDRNFKAGAFVPPPNPEDTENELQNELNRLREALASANEEAEGTTYLANSLFVAEAIRASNGWKILATMLLS